MNIKLLRTLIISSLILAMSFALAQGKEKKIEIPLTSPSFNDGEMMPDKYAYHSGNVSPALTWGNIPKKAKTLAIICDDPDAPDSWVHWVIFNIPATEKGLLEKIAKQEMANNKTLQGKNDFGNIGYDGPSPPHGTHRYFFKIYALDTELYLNPGASKAQLLKAMEGHILAHGELVGKYANK
ncbi:MAG: YbhB/YbcL family Raf kinase inhibitor-like protein [bacterium]|nr:YbhB/YbcL family Raf kinase inhibitor-like protein [bacterium]